jgi:hypothetical protein
VLLNMEQHWSSARRLAGQNELIPMLLKVDIQKIDPQRYACVYVCMCVYICEISDQNVLVPVLISRGIISAS